MLGWLPFIVGFSTPQYSRNDFELVIRASKELEWLLDTHFGAYGKGLHEKVCACCNTHAAWGEGCAPRLGALSRGWGLVLASGVVCARAATCIGEGHPVRGLPAEHSTGNCLTPFDACSAARGVLVGLLAEREALGHGARDTSAGEVTRAAWCAEPRPCFGMPPGSSTRSLTPAALRGCVQVPGHHTQQAGARA
jgi:hypothetical protein